MGDVRWPYPPAYFPWVYASGVLASHGGPSLEFTIRLAPRGAERSTRLAGAALVAPGPSFLVVSGYHGQFDAVAFLPAVLALTLWERDLPRRALWAGLLIGLGGALKTVPLLLLVALLPSVRTRREAAVLVGAAALPVLAALAPFAIAGTLPDLHVFTYRGIPGAGGLSLVADPRIVEIYMGQGPPALGPAFTFLVEHGGMIAGLALAAVAAVGLRTRATALPLAVLLWLAMYAFGVNFFFQYLIWGLPFFLMAGHLRAVLAVQLFLLGPSIILYGRPWASPAIVVICAGAMIVAWLGWVVACALQAKGLLTPRAPLGASGGGGQARGE